MKYTFVGDIHGFVKALKFVSDNNTDSEHIIQVGDYGVGFSGVEWDKKADQFNKENNIRFIRGNHDSPDQCKTMETWIPDGHVENGIMFVGGAWSIDQHRRIPGVSWWHDEELSDRAFDHIIEKYLDEKPEVMVTHDCPHNIAQLIFYHLGYIKKTRTSGWFEYMYERHQPKAWIFGHWHEKHYRRVLKNGNETWFRCLDINETCILDMEKIKREENNV